MALFVCQSTSNSKRLGWEEQNKTFPNRFVSLVIETAKAAAIHAHHSLLLNNHLLLIMTSFMHLFVLLCVFFSCTLYSFLTFLEGKMGSATCHVYLLY